MKHDYFSLLSVVVVASTGCFDSPRRLASRVTIGPDPIVLSPKHPLMTKGHFNSVCIEIPELTKERMQDYALEDVRGQVVRPRAELIASDGSTEALDQRSFLNAAKRRLCLSSPRVSDPGLEFIRVAVTSDVPILVDGVVWISTDKQ